MYTLMTEQCVRASLIETWNFLKNPANLNRITPKDLHFQILSEVPPEIHNGLILEYRITIPVIGTCTWLAEIKHIRKYAFVDEQRKGPYSFWYHYHELQQQKDGKVRIIDRVHYDVPYGLLGRVLHSLFIRTNLERIFHFRKKALHEILSKKNTINFS